MIQIYKTCPLCKAHTTISMPDSTFAKWNNGMRIQDAWPEGTSYEREVLISGICAVCQEDIFDEVRGTYLMKSGGHI